MFFFTKKKPFLKDLIPDNHVDIHSHLLPGIDDGAKTIEDTIFLMKGLQQIGFTQFITTPHTMKSVWENTREGIEGKLSETVKLLKENHMDVELRAASEYLMDSNFVEQFKSEPLLALKDNHVLVEMSYINPPIQLYDIIFELQIAGYTPVLAHPERYAFYHTRLNEYRKLKDAGCKFQINLLSTIGYYGGTAFKTANHLLNYGMIDFAGSDVHHQKHLDSFEKRVLVKDLAPLQNAIANTGFFKF